MIDKKYKWLEVMRGLAAVWVVLHHADITTKAFGGDVGSIFISCGFLGVDFFFILSGFIIAFSVSRMIESGRGYKEYLSARFFRIYLPYLPISIGLFFAYKIFPGLSAGERDIGLITSITLLPTNEVTALSVAWTLKHELLFYALFGFMFISRSFGVAVLAGWFAFVIVSFLSGVSYTWPILALIAHPLNLWFLVGILVFSAPTISLPRSIWLFLLIVLFLGLYIFTVLAFSRVFVGVVLASIVYLMVKVSNIPVHPPRAVLFLGAASYSIYLVHNPVQSIIGRLPAILGIPLDVGAFFFTVAVGSLLSGIVYYLIVESPGVAWSKAFLRKRYSQVSGAAR